MDRITRDNYPPRWLMLLGAAILAALVASAFWPVIGFGFVSTDTSEQVIENTHIRGLTLENVQTIFTSRCTFSYYPIRMLTYALDYQIWGGRPGGFKLTNALIHLANVYLTYWLLLRLFRSTDRTEAKSSKWDIAVAILAAGLFAIHPVVVEPVVWVPGREELLLTLGALGCFHFHLSGHRAAQRGQPASRIVLWHAGAAVAMTSACLSNAVAAVIPLLVTAWDLLMCRPRNVRAIVGGTAALWLLGVATIVIKQFTEVDHNVVYAKILSADWVMMILCVYWLNLKTLVWPTGLVIYYDWPNPAGIFAPQVLLGGLAAAMTALVLWLVRRRQMLVFGLSWFVLALAPTSQVMPHHIARADRFLYLPLIGLAVALAAILRPLGAHSVRRVFRVGGLAITATLLAVLTILTIRQVPVWRDDMSVWSHCVQVEPRNAYGHSRVAKQLAKAGLFEQAVQRYTLAVSLRPDHADTLAELAVLFATWSEPELRDFELAVELAEEASERSGGSASRIQRKLAIVRTSHAEELAVDREFTAAIQEYRRAIHADPEFDLPRFNLALLLTTCPERTLRRPDEAIRLALRGCELADPADAHRLAILAAAHAEAAQFDEAISAIRQAIQAAQREGDREMEEELYLMLNLYRRGHTVESADGS